MSDIDISSFMGEVSPVEKAEPEAIKAGRYDLEFVGVEGGLRGGKNGWVGMQLNFKILNANSNVFAPFTVTLDHDDEATKNRGRRDLEAMTAAMACGPWKSTNALIGKVASCKVKLNDRGYPEVDSYFGENWQKASVIKTQETQVKKPAPAQVEDDFSDDEDIPF